MFKAGDRVAIGTYSPQTDCFQWEFGVVGAQVVETKHLLVHMKTTVFNFNEQGMTHVTPDFGMASGEDPMTFVFLKDRKMFATPLKTPGYAKFLFPYDPNVQYNGEYSGF